MGYNLVKCGNGYHIGLFLVNAYYIDRDDSNRLSIYQSYYIPKMDDIVYCRISSNLEYDGMEITSLPIEIEASSFLKSVGVYSVEAMEEEKNHILSFARREHQKRFLPNRVFQYIKK